MSRPVHLDALELLLTLAARHWLVRLAGDIFLGK
jgi:hypothetical protein